jgi:ferric-dicitrate binding protein FerR (iron transport regulator)
MDQQNKWEEWASILHNEATDSVTDYTENDQDYGHVEKIFNARNQVGQVLSLKPADKAWIELRKQLSSGKRWIEWMKYAAIFILSLLLTGTAFWTHYSDQFTPKRYTSITVPNGQISNITLFDGTNVWLNAGSSLKYSDTFNRNDREIFLEGEALFSVTKDEKIPFIVHAGDAQVKVYGTEFNVKAYSNETKIETVLIEGKVQFTAHGKDVMMEPGEQLVLSKATGELVKRQVDPDEYTSWKGGKIYFNNETLFNLTQQLERWYEVKFSFDHESIKSYRFSGVINKERSLDYTLRIIQEINKIKFEFKDEQIIIKNR